MAKLAGRSWTLTHPLERTEDGPLVVGPPIATDESVLAVEAQKPLGVWVAVLHIDHEGDEVVGVYATEQAVLAAHPDAIKRFTDGHARETDGYTDASRKPSPYWSGTAYWLEEVAS